MRKGGKEVDIMTGKAWREKEYPYTKLELVGDHIVIIYFDNPPVNATPLARARAWDEIFRHIVDDHLEFFILILLGFEKPT